MNYIFCYLPENAAVAKNGQKNATVHYRMRRRPRIKTRFIISAPCVYYLRLYLKNQKYVQICRYFRFGLKHKLCLLAY